MPVQFTTSYLEESLALFRQYQKLAEGAMAQVTDEQLFAALDPEANSIAIIVKHMTGNMRSRWTDFLTTPRKREDRLQPVTIANARTGKLPNRFTFTGAAKNLNPPAGSAPRLHRCSAMGIPARSRIECTGRDRSAVSSIFSESMPASAAPESAICCAASAVRNG